ncbi:hypothetical protein NX059_011829 [Plenodomus lindquistii]|nr:hypothetical protein NX059_011829 [Plenodomus lindquistii]
MTKTSRHAIPSFQLDGYDAAWLPAEPPEGKLAVSNHRNWEQPRTHGPYVETLATPTEEERKG